MGTLTINWIINIIKESEIDELSASLNGLRIAQILACQQAELSVQSKTAANQTVDLTDLKEGGQNDKEGGDRCFLIQESYMAEHKLCSWETTCMLWLSHWRGCNGPHLPHGLSVVNTYTRGDFQEQASWSSSEKPDGHCNHYHQGD